MDTMVPIDLFGEPWVLFRDESGAAACVRDECAHRACPLSLGRVIDGRVQCAYHGCGTRCLHWSRRGLRPRLWR